MYEPGLLHDPGRATRGPDLAHDRRSWTRQFVFGPRRLDTLAHWNTVAFRGERVLHVHPDLPHATARAHGIEAHLLGYAIDPFSPESDDVSIVERLVLAVDTAADVCRCAADLAGRWVLVVDDGSDTVVMHDACGLREVCYTTDAFAERWCASQASTLAMLVGIAEDEETVRRFLGSPVIDAHPEAWWPGDRTPYREIRHLPPNHCLHLRDGRIERYWPRQAITPLGLEAAAQRAADLLRTIVVAGARRFPLALPVTAGMDSRVLLAATRGSDDIFHYTIRRPAFTSKSPDLAVPARMLRRVARQHHVLDVPAHPDEKFAALYRANVTRTYDAALEMAQALAAGFPPGRVSVSGHCSEIARDTYGVAHTRVDGADSLARVVRMAGNAFALEEFGAWLDAARPVSLEHGIGLWELFAWEQEFGIWAAGGQSQWDIVHERLTPFANRPVLTTFLGVPLHHRQGPDFAVYRRIVEILWPELLRDPINPPETSWRTRTRALVQKVVKR